MQQRPRPLPLFLELLRSETAASPERLAAALRGVKAYQKAERKQRPDMPGAIATAGRASLCDYGGDGPPVVFIPSLINPPYILDLTADNSLVRWIGSQGFRPLLVDWGEATPADAELSVAGHIEHLLLPLLSALEEPAHLVGYCLGGTMAAGAAAVGSPLSLTMIAAPWRFDGFPNEARTGLAELWDNAGAFAREMGTLPMEVLQTAFWRLDPRRTVSKFEKFGRLDPDSGFRDAFIALEDWANDGPPLTYAAARELLEDFFARNVTGEKSWRIGDTPVDLDTLNCPVLNIVSSTDRIVPKSSAARVGDVMTLAQGHVGMVVGSRGRKALWEPLSQWLRDRS